MSAKDTGGPAFPFIPPDSPNYRDWPAESGMTLRDYFAARVLPVAMRDFYGDLATGAGDAWDGHDDVAEHCYGVADAMLKARAK